MSFYIEIHQKSDFHKHRLIFLINYALTYQEHLVFRVTEVFGTTNSKNNMLDDARLLARYRESLDPELLGILYQRYMHLVYGVSLKYLKEPDESKDAVMEVFEKLISKIPGQDIRNFKSWLYVVTKNHCLKILRNKRTRSNTEASFMESSQLLHLNGEENRVDEALLSKALANLSDQQQRCIKMFFYENKSYQQIADETGYELKKVKSHIQNGKRNLKIYLDQHER